MQTSRFQLGLIATLAIGLGFSLASSQAIGYPAGAAVSMGSNPLWTFGGEIAGDTETVLTAPADQDMIVTDVLITTTNPYERVNLTLEDGTIIGAYQVHGRDSTYSLGAVPMVHQFSSGIRIPAGTSLSLGTAWGRDLQYTFSGYYAQP